MNGERRTLQNYAYWSSRKTHKSPPGPRPTLGELKLSSSWWWVYCERCPHYAPVAFAAPVILWGPMRRATSYVNAPATPAAAARARHPQHEQILNLSSLRSRLRSVGATRMSAERRRAIRVPPRGMVAKTGKLVFALGPAVECQVVDLSAGGACLRISVLRDMSKRFEFHHGAARYVCRLAWQRGHTIGVCYEGSAPKSLHTSVLGKQSALGRRK